METFTSKTKALGFVVLFLGLVGACVWYETLNRPDSLTYGWGGAAFFLLVALYFGALLVRSGPDVIIDAEGIWPRRQSGEKIRWDDIHALSLGGTGGEMTILKVECSRASRYFEKLNPIEKLISGAEKDLGFRAVAIDFAGSTPNIEAVWQYLVEHQPEKTASSD